jgi:hypothetical protein
MLKLQNGKYNVRFYYDLLHGKTDCKVTTDGSDYVGTAMVSKHDTFNPIVGRKIAFSRALKAAGVSKEDRGELFIELFTLIRMV